MTAWFACKPRRQFMFGLNLGNTIALIFVVAMLPLAGGLIEFRTEIQIAIGGRLLHKEHLLTQDV